MKSMMMLALVIGILPISVCGQGAGPEDVVRSAVSAVEALGKRVVLGDHHAAIEKMYPRWKERMAKRDGGIEKLEKDLGEIGGIMARSGVSIISFKAEGMPKVYEVWPGGENSSGGQKLTTWLVLIPTVTTYRLTEGEVPKTHTIDSHGFQVAISEKGKNDWTFINGSDVSVADLRSLFLTLPANMELPEVRREAR